MTDKWNFPGSKWWKFDFHTHTLSLMIMAEK